MVADNHPVNLGTVGQRIPKQYIHYTNKDISSYDLGNDYVEFKLSGEPVAVISTSVSIFIKDIGSSKKECFANQSS